MNGTLCEFSIDLAKINTFFISFWWIRFTKLSGFFKVSSISNTVSVNSFGVVYCPINDSSSALLPSIPSLASMSSGSTTEVYNLGSYNSNCCNFSGFWPINEFVHHMFSQILNLQTLFFSMTFVVCFDKHGWHVKRKVVWYVTKLQIFEYSCNLFLIFFQSTKLRQPKQGRDSCLKINL